MSRPRGFGLVALGAATMVFLSMVLAGPAAACAVCYGGDGSDMTVGMNNGILALLAVVGIVQTGFVALFGSIWYRTRKLRRLKKRFQLIEGER